MFEPICIDYDGRLNAYCMTARCDYQWYLSTTQGAERNLQIQRSVIKGTKVYATLRGDLKRGCILPPIVLAVTHLTLNERFTNEFKSLSSDELTPELIFELSGQLLTINPQDVYIIDGLQRTNALQQTLEEIESDCRASYLSQFLRIEIWLNIPFGAIAYRMLLLNAGQKPMSIRHQVEILSMKLKEELATIHGIDILTTLELQRRTRPGQFHLAKLSQTFQAWLQGQPNLDLRNIVMEQLVTESAIEVLGASLKGNCSMTEKDAFFNLVEWFVTVDRALPPDRLQFFANETVLQGIGAAVGSSERNSIMQPRMKKGLESLKDQVLLDTSSDPLGIGTFEEVRKGIETSKTNVGQATREMVYKAFQEYFISDGSKNMSDCWKFAASQV